ncbi:MAG: 3-deoxy-D-manno-octulosonic acid transferase, partial [Rhizobacter sp.]|nr:3-deoxy-D-manno-octulosonic acid transferase [Rhizobacter sp.]
LKFDMTPDAALLGRGRAWAERVGRPIVLAASTREGEEALLLAAWSKQPMPRPLLLIVPRHPQRFDEVAAQVTAAGFTLARRSAWNGDVAAHASDSESAVPPESAFSADVWLGDSMHEMPLYFALAQVALLGGSFEKFGGQNLIEAAACGCPIVIGPHTYNFAEAAELSLAAGAAVRVAGFDEGVAVACAMVAPGGEDKHAWRQAQALAFADRHRGAARRMATRIAGLMTR